MLQLEQVTYTPAPPGPRREGTDSSVHTWISEGGEGGLRRLGAGRLGAGTFMRLDFYAPRLLGARGKKNFFQKIFQKFQKKFSFKKKIFFFQKKFFFQEKDFFFTKTSFFFHKNIFFFYKKTFSKFFFFFQMTVFFQIKTFSNTLIKMLMFSKLFISCLSRRIVRTESAGKGMAIGKIRAVIGWKRIAKRASFV